MHRRVRQGRNNSPGCNLSPWRPHSSFSHKQKLLFLPGEALIVHYPRVSRLVSAPHPTAKSIWMLISPLITTPQTCMRCCPRPPAAPPATNAQAHPLKEHAQSGHFLPPHQAGCLCELYPTPSLSSYPGGYWGRGPRSLQENKEQPESGSVFMPLDACACHFVCQDPSFCSISANCCS